MTTRAEIVAAAQAWVGTPYRDLGRDRHGLDCVGLILAVYGGLGLINYHVPTYRTTPDGTFLSHFPLAGFMRISPAVRRSGDVLAFRLFDHACHCGVATPRGVVHAYSVHKGVFEQPLSSYLGRSLIAAFRAPGVEE